MKQKLRQWNVKEIFMFFYVSFQFHFLSLCYFITFSSYIRFIHINFYFHQKIIELCSSVFTRGANMAAGSIGMHETLNSSHCTVTPRIRDCCPWISPFPWICWNMRRSDAKIHSLCARARASFSWFAVDEWKCSEYLSSREDHGAWSVCSAMRRARGGDVWPYRKFLMQL